MGRVYSLPEEYQFTPTQPRCCSDVDRNTVSYGLVHRRTAQATNGSSYQRTMQSRGRTNITS